jgi:cell division protein FtsI/penicillin-binding protein 2
VERLLDFTCAARTAGARPRRTAAARIAQFQRREVLPRDGYNAELTIDLVVQDVIEQEARRSSRPSSPRAVIIVSDPNTGAILG